MDPVQLSYYLMCRTSSVICIDCTSLQIQVASISAPLHLRSGFYQQGMLCRIVGLSRAVHHCCLCFHQCVCMPPLCELFVYVFNADRLRLCTDNSVCLAVAARVNRHKLSCFGFVGLEPSETCTLQIRSLLLVSNMTLTFELQC